MLGCSGRERTGEERGRAMRKLTLIAPVASEAQFDAEDRLYGEIVALTGFSYYRGRGVWESPEGKIVAEAHACYEIILDSDHSALAYNVLAAFRKYGRDAGEHTLLWFAQDVDAVFEEVKRDDAATISA